MSWLTFFLGGGLSSSDSSLPTEPHVSKESEDGLAQQGQDGIGILESADVVVVSPFNTTAATSPNTSLRDESPANDELLFEEARRPVGASPGGTVTRPSVRLPFWGNARSHPAWLLSSLWRAKPHRSTFSLPRPFLRPSRGCALGSTVPPHHALLRPWTWTDYCN